MKQKYIFKSRGHTYFRCPQCDLVSTYPRPTPQVIKKHYQSKFKKGNYQMLKLYAQEYNNVYDDFLNRLEKRLKTYKMNLKGKKLLDVGCFTGEFLKLAKKRGASVYGFEMQSEAVELANKTFKGRISQTDISGSNVPKRKFDIITLLAVIEHVNNPVKMIENALRMLKKGGVLMIETPDSGSFLANLMGKYWPPYRPIEHIHLFSQKSLEVLLKKNHQTELFFEPHWKSLPVGYVYNQLSNFGPVFYRMLKRFNFVISKINDLTLPFYVGETIVIVRKK